MVITVKDHQLMMDHCLCLMAITQENSKLTTTDIRGTQDHRPKAVITLKLMVIRLAVKPKRMAFRLEGKHKPMAFMLKAKPMVTTLK